MFIKPAKRATDRFNWLIFVVFIAIGVHSIAVACSAG